MSDISAFGPEEIFVQNHLKAFAEVEASMKRLKRRVNSESQSYFNSLDGTKKLVEAFKDYSEVLANVEEMKDLGDCVERLSAVHSLLEEMNTKVHHVLRRDVLPAIKKAIREFKQCKELKGRIQQSKTDYESITRMQQSKQDAKDKEKWKQLQVETTSKWEATAEESMTRVQTAVKNHNALISGSLASLLETYRNNFIECQEYVETIQPQINQFLTFADNRRMELQNMPSKSSTRMGVFRTESDQSESKSERRKIGLPKRRKNRKETHHEQQHHQQGSRDIGNTSLVTSNSSPSGFLEFDHSLSTDDDSSGYQTPPSGMLSPRKHTDPEDAAENESSDDIIFAVDPNTNLLEVRAATYEKLIDRLTSAKNNNPGFRDVFFITYRQFSTPLQVFDSLKNKFLNDRTAARFTQLRTIAALKHWIETHPYDFKDEVLNECLVSFLRTHVEVDRPSAYKQIITIYEKICASELFKPNNPKAQAPPTIPPAEGVFDIVDVPDLARQMTLLESDIFCAITPQECLNKNWSGPDRETLSPNIIAITEQFNRTSRWVVTEIITKYQLKSRVETLRKFIQLLQHLRELNNFNGVMEVLAGLNSSAVRRLKTTWKEMNEQELRIVSDNERLMNHKNSYRTYRATLHASTPPMIPFVGVFLTDLTFLEDGNPKFTGNLINFYRCLKIGSVISKILEAQVKYKHIVPKPPIQQLIATFAPVDEEEAYTLSTRIEPRDPSEAFENLLLEEDRLKKYIAELQVRIADLRGLQKRQTNTVSLLSDQVREQQKLINELQNPKPKLAQEHQSGDIRRGSAFPVGWASVAEKKFRQGKTRMSETALTTKATSASEDNANLKSASDNTTPASNTSTKKEFVIGVCDFEAENPDELGFKQGARIEVLSKDESYGGEGWWVGRIGDIAGVFPCNFVTSEQK